MSAAKKLLEQTRYQVSFSVDHPWPASTLAELLPALLEGSSIGCSINIKTGEVTLFRKERGSLNDG